MARGYLAYIIPVDGPIDPGFSRPGFGGGGEQNPDPGFGVPGQPGQPGHLPSDPGFGQPGHLPSDPGFSRPPRPGQGLPGGGDPGFGRPPHPDQGFPGGGDPGFGVGRPPGASTQPLPIWPAKPDQTLPPVPGHPLPPTDPDPGFIWPPLDRPEIAPGKAIMLVYIPGAGYRYIVVDVAPGTPGNELPEAPEPPEHPDQGAPPPQPAPKRNLR